MSDVTRILSAIEHGDPKAADELLPLVYQELRRLAARRLAQEKPGQTLQATALVHEAYLGLVGSEPGRGWESRAHFFAAAAAAMRHILINRARDKGRQKRGGSLRRVDIDLDRAELGYETDGLDLLALDEAMTRLAAEEPRCAQLVKLRCARPIGPPNSGDEPGPATDQTGPRGDLVLPRPWSASRLRALWCRLGMCG